MFADELDGIAERIENRRKLHQRFPSGINRYSDDENLEDVPTIEVASMPLSTEADLVRSGYIHPSDWQDGRKKANHIVRGSRL